MEIFLENIGVVKNSKLSLDGLTVITGENNSGKSTVGKTLYSILDAVCNIDQKAERDRQNYIYTKLIAVKDIMDTIRFFRKPTDEMNRYPAITCLFSDYYWNNHMEKNIVEFAYDIARELSEFDPSIIEMAAPTSRYFQRRHKTKESVLDIFEFERKKALQLLNNMFRDLKKDPELIEYARESIDQTLNCEFANQIQPVKKADVESHIKLVNQNSIYFDFCIKDNHIENNNTPVFWSAPYKKVFFIDNPFLLDTADMPKFLTLDYDEYESDSILNKDLIVKHDERLKRILRSNNKNSTFAKMVLDDSLVDIRKAIDSALPGSFDFSSDKEYYIHKNFKLSFSNLATGSKMFSILKILLDRGALNSETMLILDEPEAHLHPKWQNLFAEIVVMLVKKMNLCVLLTTHSPNFMLAIDAYMRKYDLSEKTNFYQTNFLEDGFVQYQCVNDNMDVIYRDFLQYLSEVKMLRNECIRSNGD